MIREGVCVWVGERERKRVRDSVCFVQVVKEICFCGFVFRFFSI